MPSLSDFLADPDSHNDEQTSLSRDETISEALDRLADEIERIDPCQLVSEHDPMRSSCACEIAEAVRGIARTYREYSDGAYDKPVGH